MKEILSFVIALFSVVSVVNAISVCKVSGQQVSFACMDAFAAANSTYFNGFYINGASGGLGASESWQWSPNYENGSGAVSSLSTSISPRINGRYICSDTVGINKGIGNPSGNNGSNCWCQQTSASVGTYNGNCNGDWRFWSNMGTFSNCVQNCVLICGHSAGGLFTPPA